MLIKIYELKSKIKSILTRTNIPILLYGLQRSGTNYIEKCLNVNYPQLKIYNNVQDRSSTLHKHFRIYDEKKYIPVDQYANDIYIRNLEDLYSAICITSECFIICMRHPLQWYKSYKDWAIKCGWPVKQYNYMIEWFHFHEKWLSLKKENPEQIVFIRYEYILNGDYTDFHNMEGCLKISPPKKYLCQFTKVPVSQEFDANKKLNNKKYLSYDDVVDSEDEKQKLISAYNEEFVNLFY